MQPDLGGLLMDLQGLLHRNVDVVVNGYLGVGMETVWNIIKKEIPVLKKVVKTMMG